MRKALLKSACKGVAQEFIGCIPAVATLSYNDLLSALQQRFGRTLMSKKMQFDALK